MQPLYRKLHIILLLAERFSLTFIVSIKVRGESRLSPVSTATHFHSVVIETPRQLNFYCYYLAFVCVCVLDRSSFVFPRMSDDANLGLYCSIALDQSVITNHKWIYFFLWLGKFFF